MSILKAVAHTDSGSATAGYSGCWNDVNRSDDGTMLDAVGYATVEKKVAFGATGRHNHK